jgi:hypothetical protein
MADQPPDGPTDVVYLISSTSGRGETARVCWASGELARGYVERQKLRGVRYEPCTHLPKPSKDAL